MFFCLIVVSRYVTGPLEKAAGQIVNPPSLLAKSRISPAKEEIRNDSCDSMSSGSLRITEHPLIVTHGHAIHRYAFDLKNSFQRDWISASFFLVLQFADTQHRSVIPFISRILSSNLSGRPRSWSDVFKSFFSLFSRHYLRFSFQALRELFH
jgi:hypothetical protein